MSDQAPAIRISGLVKTFEEGMIRALNGVEMEVMRGEFVAIVGPSGCGKSTLLHLVAALDRPDEGTVEVLGHELRTARNLDHYRAHDVGLVFQLDNLIMTSERGRERAGADVRVRPVSGRAAGSRGGPAGACRAHRP